MRGLLTLLVAGLVASCSPHLAVARTGAAWWGQSGGPGKGGLVGAGGGEIVGGWAPLNSWELEGTGSGGLPEAPPGRGDAALETSPEDQPTRELVEEKEAEATFLSEQVQNPRTELDVPTDFYLDPLKSLQYAKPLPLEEIDLAAFDLPITVNEEVASWIEFFLTKGRRFYTGWLARSTRYIPMMEEVLADEGVPRELVYLAMIESGFSPQATSPMSAAGIWQMMLPTGKACGLRVSPWVDERRDPEKSTRAAVRHLRDLYERFDDWYLALAAYNAGAGKVSRAIDRTGSRDFWALAKSTHLRPETRNYVPKLIAAAIIAKNPDRFGFQDIPYDDVVQYDTVQVPDTTDLSLIARRIGLETDELAKLNPELRRRRTPPGRYEVKLPLGTSALFDAEFRENLQEERLVYRRHRVQSGQTLVSIARHYGVDVGELKRMNSLRSSKLRSGTTLLVPQHEAPLAPEPEYDEVEATAVAMQSGPDVAPESGRTALARQDAAKAKGTPAKASVASLTTSGGGAESADAATVKNAAATYRVKKGDTAESIARRYTVSVSDLKRTNRLNARALLMVGQVLHIPQR